MYKRSVFFKIIIFVTLTSVLKAQPIQSKIETAYRAFKLQPNLRHAMVSLSVVDGKTGARVFVDNEDIGLATASTLKTMTSAAAFHVLGPDHRYTTSLLYNGNLGSQGVLQGDIIIKGSGDPSLGSDRFEETKEQVVLNKWVKAIKAAGITTIDGSIIGDDQLFGGQSAGARWIWQDMGSYYGAGVSGLNWRENAFELILRSGGGIGKPTRLLGTQPDVSYLKIVNESFTGATGSGDKVYPYSVPYANLVYLRGTYGLGYTKNIQLSLPDAAFDAALRLQLALESAGIRVLKGSVSAESLRISGREVSSGKLIMEHQSPKLTELVYWFNQKSINLYGESLLKTMAVKWGVKTDLSDAADKLCDFWFAKLSLPKGAMRIYDGSGLSPENRVTSLAMAQVLASAVSEPWFDKYYNSFPVYNGMKMKSGTISGVLAYTGYHTRPNGQKLVFSLLVNNYSGSAQAMRQQMFSLLNALK